MPEQTPWGATKPNGTKHFASRAGIKLHHALTTFNINPTNWTVADLGCSTGGFTSCWLAAGAQHVYAADTGYGVIDYTLRQNPRVTTLERTNILHNDPPTTLLDRGGADACSIDLSWTPQHLALPAATRWLKPDAIIITLIKPHYEASSPLLRDRFAKRLDAGALADDDAEAVTEAALHHAQHELGFTLLNRTRSPIAGGKSSRKRKSSHANAEFLALLKPPPPN